MTRQDNHKIRQPQDSHKARQDIHKPRQAKPRQAKTIQRQDNDKTATRQRQDKTRQDKARQWETWFKLNLIGGALSKTTKRWRRSAIEGHSSKDKATTKTRQKLEAKMVKTKAIHRQRTKTKDKDKAKTETTNATTATATWNRTTTANAVCLSVATTTTAKVYPTAKITTKRQMQRIDNGKRQQQTRHMQRMDNGKRQQTNKTNTTYVYIYIMYNFTQQFRQTLDPAQLASRYQCFLTTPFFQMPSHHDSKCISKQIKKTSKLHSSFNIKRMKWPYILFWQYFTYRHNCTTQFRQHRICRQHTYMCVYVFMYACLPYTIYDKDKDKDKDKEKGKDKDKDKDKG
jgi:hypothetical protein